MTALPDEASAFLREFLGDAWTVEPLPGEIGDFALHLSEHHAAVPCR